MLIDVDLNLGEAVALGEAGRLGVRDRRCARSARARSKELRGLRTADGERGVEKEDCG